MKKNYQKPEFDFSVFESENEISAKGDWELGVSKKILDPYKAGDIEDEGTFDGNDGVNYGTSDFGFDFGDWNF